MESPVSIISMAGAHAHQPRVVLVVRRRHGAHGRIADLGVLGDVDQVAGDREFGAAGQAPAVHLGDHRLGQVPDAETALDHVPGPLPLAARRLVGRRADPGQVVAGGEAGSGAAQDHHPHLGVAVAGLERREDLAAQGVGQGVALGRPVEGEAAHVRRGIVGEQDAVRRPFGPPGGLASILGRGARRSSMTQRQRPNRPACPDPARPGGPSRGGRPGRGRS